jgi:chromatin structure-remodeling complex subunit SFH1
MVGHISNLGEDDLDREAYKPVLLAPIRIELDTETHRIRDYFTWNINGD